MSFQEPTKNSMTNLFNIQYTFFLRDKIGNIIRIVSACVLRCPSFDAGTDHTYKTINQYTLYTAIGKH